MQNTPCHEGRWQNLNASSTEDAVQDPQRGRKQGGDQNREHPIVRGRLNEPRTEHTCAGKQLTATKIRDQESKIHNEAESKGGIRTENIQLSADAGMNPDPNTPVF